MATRTRRLLSLAALIALLLSMASCAPGTGDGGPRVEVEQLSEEISFYPREAGATWQFLPSGAALSEPPLYLRSDGPTVLGGEVVTAWRLVGRGIDEVSYRRYDTDGVHLLRTVRPGSVIEFDPPVRELPGQSELRVGETWEGQTTAHVIYPEARVENREATLEIRYTYHVVDRRTTTVPAGQFDVYVIDFQSETVDEDGTVLEQLSQSYWFTPYVGEVRNRYGYFLTETNFPLPQPEAAAQP